MDDDISECEDDTSSFLSSHSNCNYSNEDTGKQPVSGSLHSEQLIIFTEPMPLDLDPMPSKKPCNSLPTEKPINNKIGDCSRCKEPSNDNEPFCHVKLDSILKLKESTKRLLCVLEEIQGKTHSKNTDPIETRTLNTFLASAPKTLKPLTSATEIIGASAIKRLETQTKALDAIYLEDEDDDCSVYKRLTRTCNCLNKQEYNDFTIHFNENIKFHTSNFGELIKNMRILKKFLYMNGDYTKHALMFLNEGLSQSTHTEKVEITHGCAYADICNIFDENTIVTMCISWPCKYDNYGDAETQDLTACFLYKMAKVEEGRRYLNLSSKITNDIKKLLRKKVLKLHYDVIVTLNEILNLLHPPIEQSTNVTYYCKSIDEDVSRKTINALLQYREYMTLEEIITHLDLLNNWSTRDNAKMVMTMHLQTLVELFQHMLIEYDNSEMNIIITSILNNIVTKNAVKGPDLPVTLVSIDVATDGIKMKNEFIQIPPKKNGAVKSGIIRKTNKSKLGLGISPAKHRSLSKRSTNLTSNIIVVPIEE